MDETNDSTNRSMAALSREDLWRFLQMTLEEERHYNSLHHTVLAFFTGLISAVLTATVAGLLQATTWFAVAAIAVGPAVMLALCRIADFGTSRFYQRFLEAITMRAKAEQALGLSNRPNYPPSNHGIPPMWTEEPLIPIRHLRSRSQYSSSDEFVRGQLDRGGDRRTTKRMLRAFALIAWVLLAVVVVRVLWLAILVNRVQQSGV
jgi:hypothetical protein